MGMAKRWTSGSRSSTPMMLLRPLAKLLATRLGEYDRSRAARSTRLRVASEMRSRPFMALDAVVSDTPARRATSVSVAGRDGGGPPGYPPEGGEPVTAKRFRIRRSLSLPNYIA